jgi:hypothetical protein
MELGPLGGGGSLTLDVIEEMVGLKQVETAGEAGAALFKQVLDTQKAVMTDLFQAMGIGVNLDVKA